MNILASYKWLQEYLQTDLSPEEFAREFSLRSMSVESLEKGAEAFANMVVGQIKEIKPHPKADRLRIAVTDIGGQTVEIVCGGSNLYVDQKVFVALPGAKVRWHGEGELIELKETEIRGVKSIGMICSPIEVGFEKLQGDEREIWDLTAVTQAKPGTWIADALDLNDVIFDIEITTNRPDCMGVVGLAREAGAALQAPFVWHAPSLPQAEKGIDVSVEAKKLCSRYMAATIKDVKVGPSPWWLQKKLLQSGHRPINNIVDITNYVLHEYGQPLHAFDASKVRGKIVVRLANAGEVLKALDGKEYELTPQHLVIADSERPLAIAGVMGGLESGTTTETTTVVFEAAAFDPVSIRKTSRDLNLQSDSQLIFEKGLSSEALPAALARALELAQQLAGGQLVGITDVRTEEYHPETYPVLLEKIRSRIGVEISDEQISDILTRLGFTLEGADARVMARVPYWRDHDIEAEVDLTEEVARIYGYHKMPLTLPSAPPPSEADDHSLVWELWIKKFLASVGCTEFFGYSFIDTKTLEKYAVSPEQAVRVFNPLAEDLSHLRPTLLPSLLRDIERNQANVPSAKVFELSRVHLLRSGDLPEERFRLVVAEYGNENAEEAFMNLKGALAAMGEKTGVALVVGGTSDDDRWHVSRRALVALEHEGDKKVVGTLGQVSELIQDKFGILRPVFVLDLDIEAIMPLMRKALRYVPVSEFPVVTRDISFVVTERTSFEDLTALLKKQSVLVQKVDLVDIYRGAGVEEGKKSMTLSLTLASPDRTLTSAEVEEVMITIGHTLTGNFNATMRG